MHKEIKGTGKIQPRRERTPVKSGISRSPQEEEMKNVQVSKKQLTPVLDRFKDVINSEVTAHVKQ
jgi:hypothetical protein